MTSYLDEDPVFHEKGSFSYEFQARALELGDRACGVGFPP